LGGQVRVGVPEEYGSSVLPVVLAHFAREHPEVEITLRHGASAGFPEALARDELDLAVIVADRGGVPGEALALEPTLWVSSARHLPHEREPIPLALFEPGCWWRDQALAMLEARGVRWRVVCTSASVAGIAAAVASGIAVAVMGRSTVPPGASVLTEADGFPPLPASNVILGLRSGTPTAAVRGMADAIRVALASPAA
jgi:DNA-binding transcriptional LysR family regulator